MENVKGLELNKIYNESNLETMAKMPECFVDLTVTSPPYDGLRDYNGYSFPFEEIAKELFRVTKEGGVVVWVVGDSTVKGTETGTSFRQALFFMRCGFNLHDTMIYKKNVGGAIGSNLCYRQSFEYMLVFSKGRPKSINLIHDKVNKTAGRVGSKTGKRKVSGDHKLSPGKNVKEIGRRENVWLINCGNNSGDDKIAFKHPAVFPQQLAHDHILSWSNENDIIYDPFMRSGTTAKMSLILNRKNFGSEISAEYVEIANKRLHQNFANDMFATF